LRESPPPCELSALSVSASSLSSTFDIESVFTAQEWIERLERPLVNNFIAVAYSSEANPDKQTIYSGHWVGSATLLGPIPKANYELSESGGPEIGEDDFESKWQMTAVYMNPEHRRNGVARMLIKGALDYAAMESGKGKRCRTRIMIHPSNIVVKDLYDGLGFVDAGRCTLAEAFLSTGDEKLLPGKNVAFSGLFGPER
jgi:GNAT superfamily N-acetyltransferase